MTVFLLCPSAAPRPPYHSPVAGPRRSVAASSGSHQWQPHLRDEERRGWRQLRSRAPEERSRVISRRRGWRTLPRPGASGALPSHLEGPARKQHHYRRNAARAPRPLSSARAAPPALSSGRRAPSAPAAAIRGSVRGRGGGGDEGSVFDLDEPTAVRRSGPRSEPYQHSRLSTMRRQWSTYRLLTKARKECWQIYACNHTAFLYACGLVNLKSNRQ